MDLHHIIVLALVQGLTEFLPISSSAHLILVPRFLNWPDQGLAFDVAVHVGTLAAVLWYFRSQLSRMGVDWLASIRRGHKTGDSTLAWSVLWGTVPVGLAGLFFGDYVTAHLRTPLVIATTTIGFGILLWWVDRIAAHDRNEHQITWKDAMFVGCAQAIALIPGTSRSGVTITAALVMGLDPVAAARLSFLMSIPVIVLAGGLETHSLLESTVPIDWRALLFGSVVSASSAYLCIHYFLKLVQSVGMMPFVIYRLVLGCVLLLVFLEPAPLAWLQDHAQLLVN